MKNEESSNKDRIKSLRVKCDDMKRAKAEFDLTRKKIEETFARKEKSMKNELSKRDTEIENLKNKISSMSNSSFNNTGKDLTQGTSFTIVNDHAIKNDLKSNSGLYSGARQDFQELTHSTDKQTYDKVREENTLLRDALKELQDMMTEVAEHRQTIIQKNYRTDQDIQTPVILKELKAELFNLNGSSLSSSTLAEMRNNIIKFKEYMKKLDELSISGTGQDNIRIPFQGIEQIPKTSIQAENLINFKNVLENYKYMVDTQDSLIKKAIKQNQTRTKNQFKNFASKTLFDNDMIENARDFINKQKSSSDQDMHLADKAKRMLFEVQTRIAKEKQNYDVSFFIDVRCLTSF